MQKNRRLISWISGLLFTGLMALLIIVGVTYWLGLRAQNYFDEVVAARNARSAAVDLRYSLASAESSQRGFLVTGNEIYLAPYETAKTNALRNVQSVTATLRSFDETKASADRFEKVVTEKFAEMEETVALKRERRDVEVAKVLRSNRGKALMDEANIYFSGALRAADARLATGVREHREATTLLEWVSLLGAITVIGVVAAAGFAAFRYTATLREASDAVTLLNAELETRVKERTSELARANEEVQRFAYIVTHDLRAPLVNIMGFTSELESGVKSMQQLIDKADLGNDPTDTVSQDAKAAATEDLPEAIGFIRSSTRKMDQLINAILKISREGRRTLRAEPINLRELVDSSLKAVQHQISEADGEVVQTVNAPRISTDRLALELIVGNLLDNAVKYRSKDRPLRLAIKGGPLPGGRVWMELSDNGRGIAEQDLERVFELFRRAGPQDQPGEGIGLAHVRTVVRNLGGDITVTSRLGEGSTFRITLPRYLPANESPST